jgi:hypothetical protein
MRRTLPPLAALPLLACIPDPGHDCAGYACTHVDLGESSGTDGDTDTGPDTGEFPGFWPGVACTPDADETPRFYFDLRAGKDPERDYFRLPFPADLRRRGGGLDLEGFPRPPPEFAPAPELAALIDRWMAHLEQDTPGFAVNGPVLFRSSVGVARAAGIRFLNVDPDSPNFGAGLNGLRFHAENGASSKTNYLCPNWLAVEPIDGVPLEPGTTYAVVLTKAMEPSGGGEFTRDADLERMLGDTRPDGEAAAAWDTFSPLRAYLASPDREVAVDDIVAATVFTTAPHRDLLAAARAAVYRGPLHASGLHVCTAAGDSPCSTAPGLTDDEREERRCGPPSPGMTEIHGRVTLPIFQEGRPPYATWGGKIQRDADGPVLSNVQDVCFALTLPTAAAPPAGFPAVVFATGTRGSFRSAIHEGLAADLAAAGIATLSLEAVLHGERRGDTDADGKVDGLPVDQLVFNLRNPDSARDTMVQGAIDQFTAVRLAADLPAATFPEPPPATLDPANLFFMGHSQGAQAGALFLPFEPLVRTAVLSGAGANLPLALLAKSEPKVELGGAAYPPRDLLQLAFQERPDRPVDTDHPVLALFNTFVNRSDADAYAAMLRRAPLDEVGPKHLLMYIGHVDHYTPLRTAGSLAVGAGLAVADNLFPGDCDQYTDAERAACGYVSTGFLPEVTLPASANAGGRTAVALMRPESGDRDGHYVAFAPAERARITSFFASALAGAAPTVTD